MQRCNDATMQRCNDATMRRCDDATMGQCDNATMRQCNNGTMGQCDNGTMRQCDNATMQQCNDATMQRCNVAMIRQRDDPKHNKTMPDTTTRHPVVYHDARTIQRYHFTLKTKHLIPNTTNLTPEITQYRVHSALTSKPTTCTSKHTSYSHPTALCKNYCRRVPVVAIVIMDNTTDDTPTLLFL
jgi:hypothetical protein